MAKQMTQNWYLKKDNLNRNLKKDNLKQAPLVIIDKNGFHQCRAIKYSQIKTLLKPCDR